MTSVILWVGPVRCFEVLRCGSASCETFYCSVLNHLDTTTSALNDYLLALLLYAQLKMNATVLFFVNTLEITL